MARPAREKPKKAIREALLNKPELKLWQVADLVDSPPKFQKLFWPAEEEWQRYFQSPVDKAAKSISKTRKKTFEFNKLGALVYRPEAEKFLLKWLEVAGEDGATRAAIRGWLKDGKVLTDEAIDKIAEKLKKETLPNQALYNQPICRLVRRDQLRYDPDYQIIYQLTPGQSRLLEKDPERLLSYLEQINLNRRTYWGISEVFQSLIAMFDSELGRVAEKKREEETKEFIRIEVKNRPEADGGSNLTPYNLNMYSPLRFWAPPPVFARCVFHMIFWRSVITNKDLYGRDVIKDQGGGGVDERIKERVDYYYVIINWFNAAAYRIANYDELFLALMAVARSLFAGCGKVTNKKLSDVGDVQLVGREINRWFYPAVFEHTTVKRPRNPNLTLPFASPATRFWELPRRYQEGRGEDFTRVSDFLKFLRDRALELILWSKYQMEIRSIGIIPIQHLYRLELTDGGWKHLRELVKLFDPVADLDYDAAERLSVNDQINRHISAVAPEEIDRWIKLVKVYGGTHREIIEPEALQRDRSGHISWLKKRGRRQTQVEAGAVKKAGGEAR